MPKILHLMEQLESYREAQGNLKTAIQDSIGSGDQAERTYNNIIKEPKFNLVRG